MKNCFLKLVLVMCMILFSITGFCEDITNYAECDVCYGSIHLDPLETKKIFGQDGLRYLSDLPDKSVVKIDLDGMMEPGNLSSADAEFELKIWVVEDLLFIKDIKDGSLIQMTGTNSGSVHLYLESSKENEIELQDSVDDAWIKMKTSNIYSWIGLIENKQDWYEAFRKKILSVCQILKK